MHFADMKPNHVILSMCELFDGWGQRGESALMLAVKDDLPDIAIKLLEAGADKDLLESRVCTSVINKIGLTLLAVALLQLFLLLPNAHMELFSL